MSDRYSRQILYPGIGAKGQQLLAGARVAIVGVGATGAASASLLARAGVGHLTLIDRDFVESSNLQRQILFDEADAAATLPKAEAARRKILLCNSSIQVEAAITDLNPANVHTLLSQSHILLDCTDNFETRYLLNDYAVREGKPWIYAAAIGAYAATMNILPGQGEPAGSQTSLPAPCCSPTACLACVFPTPPSGQVETCDTVGILSMAVNLAASIQSAEALKFLTHQPHLMRRTLLSQDLWTNQHREISTAKPNPDCPVCAGRVFSHLAGVFRPHITLCGRNSVQIHEHQRPIHLAETHADAPSLHSWRANLHRFSRWPRSHPGHHGHSPRQVSLRPFHRLLIGDSLLRPVKQPFGLHTSLTDGARGGRAFISRFAVPLGIGKISERIGPPHVFPLND
jgi:molybdopterin/thiamine biosynthesis adenylyltransferase